MSNKKNPPNQSFTTIDQQALNRLSEEELLFLNNKIIERLKVIRQKNRSLSLAKFNIMDKIYFIHNGKKIAGTIIRLNQKTASVITDDHQRWTVSPNCLVKIIEV